MILKNTDKNYNILYLPTVLRRDFNAKFSKPYPRDYRQNPYYKQSFNLKIYAKIKKYDLEYDPETNTIKNKKTGKPFYIFSFDEASNQFKTNNTKVWSLFKPEIEKVTDTLKCKVAGSYSLTSDGTNDLFFMENSKKETIVECLESLRSKNPEGTIMLLIDNFPSHKSTLVKEKAKELNIILCYLPPYSPQLQPIERIWKDIKKHISQYKINKIEDYKNLDKNETTNILKELVQDKYYELVISKNKWNKVFNNYILQKLTLATT